MGRFGWRALLRNRTALTGTVITSFVLLAIVIGAELMPYSATDMDFINILAPPSLEHPFGTDSFGRDVLTRALFGGRISFLVSGAGIALGGTIGVTTGLLAAWYGGASDTVLMRIVDLLFAFPSFVLALFLMVVLGFGVPNVMIAIALVYFPLFARLTRNTALLVKEEPYVQAARLMGQPTRRILFLEILPNIGAPILVQASVGVAFGVEIEVGVSFLGLGVQPPTPSLGVIMADGREYFQRSPWVLTLSGLFISIALLGLNLLGDGIRDLTRSAPALTPGPPLVEIRDLRVSFRVSDGEVEAVRGIDLDIRGGEVLGVIGESGSGKTVSMTALLRLLPDNVRVTAEALTFAGEPVLVPSPTEFRAWRGRRLAMIFQKPAGAFNPAKTIGWHLARIAERRVEIGRAEKSDPGEAIRWLGEVGIPKPE